MLERFAEFCALVSLLQQRLDGNRLVASVQLIAAMGGGWDAGQIATEGEKAAKAD